MSSFENLSLITEVLSKPTAYDTPAVFSPDIGLRSENLNFSTLDEHALLQKVIQDYKSRKAMEGWFWKAGLTLVGALIGAGCDQDFDFGDGINHSEVVDLLGGASAGFLAGGLSSSLLQNLDEQQIAELGLEWTKTPESYLFHVRSHNGNASRRLLLVSEDPQTNQPHTQFAVQFPDGYVALLGILREQLYKVHFPIAGSFAVSGKGFGMEFFKPTSHLGEIQADNGMKLPVELWQHSDMRKSMIAIPYSKPHQFIY